MVEKQLNEALNKAARMGQGKDTEIGHLTPREVVIPIAVQKRFPEAMRALRGMFIEAGLDYNQFVVGNRSNKINPRTGKPQFEEGDGGGGDPGEGGGGFGGRDSSTPDSTGTTGGNVGGVGSNNSDVSGRGQESGPGINGNDNFGGNIGGVLGDTSKGGFGFGGIEGGKAAANMGSLGSFDLGEQVGYSFGPNTPSLSTDFATPVNGVMEAGKSFGLTNYDAVTGMPSVTGPTSTTTPSTNTSNALANLGQNPTTAQISAALAANAAQQANLAASVLSPGTPTTNSFSTNPVSFDNAFNSNTPSSTTPSSTTPSTVDVAKTEAEVQALENAMNTAAPSTPSPNPTDIGTAVSKGADLSEPASPSIATSEGTSGGSSSDKTTTTAATDTTAAKDNSIKYDITQFLSNVGKTYNVSAPNVYQSFPINQGIAALQPYTTPIPLPAFSRVPYQV